MSTHTASCYAQALGRKDLLLALLKRAMITNSKIKKVFELVSQDFSTSKWKKVAVKSAMGFVSKRKFRKTLHHVYLLHLSIFPSPHFSPSLAFSLPLFGDMP